MIRFFPFSASVLAAVYLTVADLPPAHGAPGAQNPSMEDLLGRIECTAWRRNRLEEGMERLVQEPGNDWTHGHQIYFLAMRALEDFEWYHVKSWVDDDLREVIEATYWPDGVPDDKPTQVRCKRYQTTSFLRAPVVVGIDETPDLEMLPMHP